MSTVSKTYLFNTDDFAQNDPDLVPKNHALSDDQLKEYGCLVSQLRRKFEDKGIDMLQTNLQDSETAAKCFHFTVKRLVRRKQAKQEPKQGLPKASELTIA